MKTSESVSNENKRKAWIGLLNSADPADLVYVKERFDMPVDYTYKNTF